MTIGPILALFPLLARKENRGVTIKRFTLYSKDSTLLQISVLMVDMSVSRIISSDSGFLRSPITWTPPL
jgi:hypothetical protein